MIDAHPATKTFEYVTQLAVEIGARPIGSPANHAAAGMIASNFQRLGMMPEMLRFDAPVWRDLSSRVIIDGETYSIRANTFSPPCEKTAQLLSAGTLEELTSRTITDKIVLLYGELAKEPLWAKTSPIGLTPAQERLFDALERGKPAVILFTRLAPSVWEPITDADFEIPSAVVPPELALALAGRVGTQVTVRIDVTRTWSYSDHVIARQPGKTKNIIIVTAHFDTMIDTPGAWDNASGAGALIALGDRLLGRYLPAWIEYAALNNEEYYGCGTALSQCYDRYMQQHRDMSSVIAAINLDGIGQMLGTNSITVMAHSDDLSDTLDQVLQTFPAVKRVDPWVESTHSLYAARGVPSFAISSTAVTSVMHTPHDTMEWLSPTKLDEAVQLTIRLIEALADKSPQWARP